MLMGLGSALALLVALQFVSGHICAIFPPQRGSLSTALPGDDSCFRRVGECGGDEGREQKNAWFHFF